MKSWGLGLDHRGLEACLPTANSFHPHHRWSLRTKPRVAASTAQPSVFPSHTHTCKRGKKKKPHSRVSGPDTSVGPGQGSRQNWPIHYLTCCPICKPKAPATQRVVLCSDRGHVQLRATHKLRSVTCDWLSSSGIMALL